MAFRRTRQVTCAAGVSTRLFSSFWTNVPSTFVVEVDPPDAAGSWVERASFLPAGVGLKSRRRGPVTSRMEFHRKYLDSSYEIEVTTDRPAVLTIR